MIQNRLSEIKRFTKNILEEIDWKCITAVLIAFIVTRFMVMLVTYFSMAQIPVLTGDDFWRYNSRNIIPDGLIRWDSAWYLQIIQNGYTFKSTAFFPLYPLLIGLFSFITGNLLTAGLWVSNVSFLIALFYLYTIARQEFDDATAGRVVFYIAAAPAAFFFSTVYTESVFLLFVVAAFYYARNKKWLMAAIMGALASATRLAGALVMVFIFFEAIWQQGVRFIPKPWSIRAQFSLLADDLRLLPKAWKGILAAIFSLSGLAAYMLYLSQKFGDAFAFLHAESYWFKTVGWDWLPRLLQYTYDMHKLTGGLFAGGIGNIKYLLDTLSVIVFIPLVVIVLFKFRPSFSLFTLFSFIMPLVSGNPLSMRRYVLPLIPCYFLLAIWGKRAWVDRIIVGISLPLQAYLLVLFSHWYFGG